MTQAQKVYLVAGVGAGLGTAVVSLLASGGATAIGVARTSKALDPIEKHARARGWSVGSRTADLLERADVDRMVLSVLEEYGHVDGVSINAGRWVGGESLIHRMSDSEWNDAMRLNTEPIYRVARALFPHFLEQGHGSVVLVSAAPAVRWAGSAAYCTAKGGIVDLVPKLARDYRPHGIRVNGVLPGSMANDVGSLDPPAADQPVTLTNTRLTSPWEVARAIQFLLTDESRWTTGSLLVVDGGLSTGGKEHESKA
jgi:A-factor type gamma-butyrolactone 1'-reductase (1S-forming)